MNSYKNFYLILIEFQTTVVTHLKELGKVFDTQQHKLGFLIYMHVHV